jgi:hypothetical protein
MDMIRATCLKPLATSDLQNVSATDTCKRMLWSKHPPTELSPVGSAKYKDFYTICGAFANGKDGMAKESADMLPNPTPSDSEELARSGSRLSRTSLQISGEPKPRGWCFDDRGEVETGRGKR